MHPGASVMRPAVQGRGSSPAAGGLNGIAAGYQVHVGTAFAPQRGKVHCVKAGQFGSSVEGTALAPGVRGLAILDTHPGSRWSRVRARRW